MNAPAAGKITEHLAAEEDTVTVGQDLFRIEPGEAGESESKPAEPKSDQSQHGEKTPSPPEPAK